MRERERRLERIADGVGEAAIAAEPRLELRRPHRVDEDQAAELFRLRPHGVKLRVGELEALDAAADRDAAQAELLDALFELLDRQIRVLQRHGGEGDEAIGLGRAQLRQLLVLQLDERLGDVALGLVPVGIDAERLDVDALPVHGLDALGAHHQLVGLHLQSHQRHRLREPTMRMDVDGLDAAAAHHHLAPPRRTGGLRVHMRRVQETAARENGAPHCPQGAIEKVSSGRHAFLPAGRECRLAAAARRAALAQ